METGRVKSQAKRRWLTVLAVITVCCLAAAALRLPIAANAASVQATALIASQDAVVRMGSAASDSMEQDGVLVEADGAYSGSINGIFTGDTTLTFGFQADEPYNNSSNFIIRISDVTDPSNEFIVKYRTVWTWDGGGETGVLVGYDVNGDGSIAEPEMRSSKYDSPSTWYGNEGDIWGELVLTAPAFSNYYGDKSGNLQLHWDGDVLQVLAQHHVNKGMRVIAAFDGTDNFVSGTSWGLPKIQFPQGYRIEFEAWDPGPDVYFSSVTTGGQTYSLAQEELTEEPSFYTTWKEMPIITVNRSEIMGVIGQEVEAAPATVTIGGKVQDVYSVIVTGPNNFREDITDTLSFTPTESGDYTVTYQGVESSSSPSNIVTVQCGVFPYHGTDALIDAPQGITVETAKTSISIADDGSVSGLRATFTGDADSFALTPVFTGNFNISMQADLMEVGGGFSEVRLRFTDVEDAANTVDLVLLPGIASWSNWFTHAVVEYKGERYTTSYNNTDNVWDTQEIADRSYKDTEPLNGWYEAAGLTDFVANFVSGEGTRDSVGGTGYFAFDVETLSFLTRYNGNEYVVASFTDPKYEWSETLEGFQKGYTVEVLVSGAAPGASLTITQINELSTAWAALPVQTEQVSLLLGEEEEEIEATLSPYYDDHGVLLLESFVGYDMGYLLRSFAGEFTVTADGEQVDKVDLTKVGTVYTLVYEGGAQRTVTVLPDETAPTVALNGVSSEVIVLLGEGLDAMKTDVTVTDALDGVIASDKVSIKVKAPQASEFTAFTADYRFEKKGVYILRYEVQDAADNVGWLDRTIVVKDGTAPALTVNGTVGENYYVGQAASLPSAKAEKGSDAFDVLVSVTLDGETVFSGNGANANSVRFDRPGTYMVTYYAADDEIVPNETVKTYTITVIEDTEAPVISVDFTQTTAKPGDVITLPSATATDNADEGVTVNVRVQFGNEEISVSNGQFTAEREGTYTIIYSAADDSGQTSEQRFTITLLEAGGTQTGEAGCSGTVLTTVGGIALGIGMIAAAVILCRKKRTKIN